MRFRALRASGDPRGIDRIVIDALQVAPEFSGIGRRLLDMGSDLHRHPAPVPVQVRCARDVAGRLREAFPAETEFVTPIGSSRPRAQRVIYQQLIAPLVDRSSTLLVCPGDQAPVWGRARILFVLHDVRRIVVPQSTGRRLEVVYYRIVTRRGVRRAAAILTISEFSREEIVRLFRPAAPIAVVTTPLETDGERNGAGADGTAPLLTVGALRPYKGLETLIAALSELSESQAEVPRVICVGTDESGTNYARRLRRLADEQGVGDRFELRGWVSDEELRRLRASCAGAVSPSYYEGFGLPLAESLASGLPTVASSIPSHREIAGEAALFFEPGDAGDLACALSRLMGDPTLRQRLSSEGMDRAASLGRESLTWGEAIANVARGTFAHAPSGSAPEAAPSDGA